MVGKLFTTFTKLQRSKLVMADNLRLNSGTLDVEYIKSLPGLLKVAEIVSIKTYVLKNTIMLFTSLMLQFLKNCYNNNAILQQIIGSRKKQDKTHAFI